MKNNWITLIANLDFSVELLAFNGITVLLLSARDFLSSNSALKALRVNQSPFLRIILENPKCPGARVIFPCHCLIYIFCSIIQQRTGKNSLAVKLRLISYRINQSSEAGRSQA